MLFEKGRVKPVAIIAAIILFCGMIAYYWFDKQREEEFGPGIDGMKQEERLSLKKNIVVLGVDERPEEYDVGRSDTLFVVMLDTQNKSAGLLSIPRDTRVRIPKHGWDKINHAYAYGKRELTQRTVEEFLGIRVNNYVMVDFKGFTGLVDAIGGVDIDVEEDMYYRDTWDGFTVDLKKGRQHMDGKTAIQYVRYRDEEGDIGRIRRQQRFLMAVYDKITSEQLLTHIPGLAKQLTAMIKTDMDISDMVALGRALHSMVKESGISMNTVPGEGRYIDDISYWIPDVQEMRKLMAEMQGAEMTARYKSAADMMANEYNKNIETKPTPQAESKQDDKKDKTEQSRAEQDKLVKEGKTAKTNAERRLQELKKRQEQKSVGKTEADQKSSGSSADKNDTQAEIRPARSSVVVRLVNCSGDPAAADIAASRLRNAGFTVISGGSGNPIGETTVISTTNNGAVVSKLSSVPFAHNLRITRDGAADCDGVVMLGKNFK